jgi:hypothetical protein
MMRGCKCKFCPNPCEPGTTVCDDCCEKLVAETDWVKEEPWADPKKDKEKDIMVDQYVINLEEFHMLYMDLSELISLIEDHGSNDLKEYLPYLMGKFREDEEDL